MDNQYEIMSPWAEVEPVPPRGMVTPRLTDLSGKKIGLLCNHKMGAPVIMDVIEKRLKERFSGVSFTRYTAGMDTVNIPQMESQNKAKFEKWVSEVDAVISAVAD
jgi:hypothetical protein